MKVNTTFWAKGKRTGRRQGKEEKENTNKKEGAVTDIWRDVRRNRK